MKSYHIFLSGEIRLHFKCQTNARRFYRGNILLVHALMLSQSKVWACVLNHSPLPLMNDSFRRTISIENVAPDSVLYAFQ